MQYASVMTRTIAPPDTDLITVTKEGLWRVSRTRVSIDSIVHGFKHGATPEQIVQDFDSLSLAQVYGIVHFYLTHRRTVEAYLRIQAQQDKALRRTLATKQGKVIADIRRRVDARRRSRTRAA